MVKDIANSVMSGIVMEYDVPSKNNDTTKPILDMKVWMDKRKIFIIFKQFHLFNDVSVYVYGGRVQIYIFLC